MYADKITESMQATISETNRRREKQMRYNKENGITPQQIQKALTLSPLVKEQSAPESGYTQKELTKSVADPIIAGMSRQQLEKTIARTRKLMNEAAARMDFMEAAQYRDEMFKLESMLN